MNRERNIAKDLLHQVIELLDSNEAFSAEAYRYTMMLAAMRREPPYGDSYVLVHDTIDEVLSDEYFGEHAEEIDEDEVIEYLLDMVEDHYCGGL